MQLHGLCCCSTTRTICLYVVKLILDIYYNEMYEVNYNCILLHRIINLSVYYQYLMKEIKCRQNF